MRDFKGMKRQRGRNRGGGGGGQGGGGGKPQQNANRAFDSNGPDNIKVRGHAQHVFEKYQQLARDATSSGDRVLAENFLQHAEHYFRVLRTIQPNRPISDFVARDNFASGYDIDFEDESGAQALPDAEPEANDGQNQNQNQGGDNGEQRGEYRDQQPRENRDRWENRQRDGQRDDRPREDRQRDGQRNDGQRDGQQRNRYDRDRQPRDDRGYRNEGEGGEAREGSYRDRQPREDRGYREDRAAREDGAREDRPREERQRDDRPREDRGPREDRPRRERNFEPRADRDPLAVVEPKAQPLTTPAPADTGASMLRSHDGEVSHAPAFLQAATPAPAPTADAEEAPVKKTRGRPKKVKEDVAADEG